jgi:hypothetical protein
MATEPRYQRRLLSRRMRMTSTIDTNTQRSQSLRAVREHAAIESEGQLLSCFVHRPSEGSPQPRPAVAIFHGLMGAKGGLHQLYVKLADELARVGIVALRVDFRGRGDSGGDSVDVTPQADIDDAKRALDWLEAQPDVDPACLALIGHSWGGAIAACLAGRDARVGVVAMWGSVPGGVMDWSPPMREVDGRQVAELWGNLVGQEFYEGLRHLHTLRDVTKARVPLLLVYGTEDEAVSGESASEARRALTEAGVPHEAVVIEGADHALMRYEWEREAIERTVDWLVRSLRPGS